MPLRPCPFCHADSSRLLDEASRFAVVWYYRCASCSHVWSIGKVGGEIHHVTPMKSDDARARSVGVSFLRTELHAGMTFAGLAADATLDDEKRRRRRLNAMTAYDAVLTFFPRAALTADEADELAVGLERLRTAIDRIPA